MNGGQTVRVAAAGDLHVDEAGREAVATALAAMDRDADLILLAGDLTTHGEPEQAAVLADACRAIGTPIIAVLGNHDLHAGRERELSAVLRDAGIVVLDRHHSTVVIGECRVGVAGIKGFVGGFRDHTIPDFGEASLRGIYAETGAEVEALDAALREIALCPFRIALLHYAPVAETLEGEPREIWAFLGTDRLVHPIVEHRPDIVLHGHAHAGSFEGSIGNTPVRNVSVPVMKQDFRIFQLEAEERAAPPIH